MARTEAAMRAERRAGEVFPRTWRRGRARGSRTTGSRTTACPAASGSPDHRREAGDGGELHRRLCREPPRRRLTKSSPAAEARADLSARFEADKGLTAHQRTPTTGVPAGGGAAPPASRSCARRATRCSRKALGPAAARWWARYPEQVPHLEIGAAAPLLREERGCQSCHTCRRVDEETRICPVLGQPRDRPGAPCGFVGGNAFMLRMPNRCAAPSWRWRRCLGRALTSMVRQAVRNLQTASAAVSVERG